MDEEAKQAVLGTFSYGLYVVSVRGQGRVNAFTANWVTQVSFDPPLVAVAVENDGLSITLIEESEVFALNVLDAGQRPAASFMARRSRSASDKPSGVAYHEGEATGCPILDEALGYVECQVANVVPAGDHTIFIGEIIEAGVQHQGTALTLAEAGLRYRR